MVDDIDDLLDEVESSLSHATTTSSSNKKASLSHDSTTASSNKKSVKNAKSTISSESVKTDDLLDLLADIDEPPIPVSRPILLPRSSKENVSGKSNSPHLGNGSGKCSRPHLAGTSVPPGMSTGVTLRACDRLRCLKCDMDVVTMDGFCWSNTIDYLFLRNNYPDMARLCARLEPQRVARAYACQCQHCSLTEPTTPANVGGLQWVCGGHPPDNKIKANSKN